MKSKPTVDLQSFYLLEEVEKLLQLSINKKDIGNSDYNLALLRTLAKKQNITFLFNQIRNNSSLLEDIANQSYSHFNYFDKIVLIDSKETGYRLTLHIWIPPFEEKQLDEDRIHNHRFNFWSMILSGRLKSQFYSEDYSGLEYYKYKYTPNDNEMKSSLKFVSKSHLVKTKYCELTAGEGYFLPFNKIHNIILPTDQITSTLVLRGPRLRKSADVYNHALYNEVFRMDKPKIKKAELEKKLVDLSKIIGNKDC